MHCKISDIKKFANILFDIILQIAGDKLKVKLKNSVSSWYPDWLPKEYNDTEYIKNYLEKIPWKNKKYFGEFFVSDIKKFLNVFLDYPSKYGYQDIELFAINSSYVFVISIHATFWIIHENEEKLKTIAKIADKENVTVMPYKYLD